jgi:hypothetical protein
MPTVRSAGGSGTAMIISGKTPNAASVTATTGTAILPTYSTADLRTLISGWVKPKLDLVTTHWLSAVGNLIDGEPWKLDPTYQSRSLTTLTNAMATQINGKFFSTAAAYPAFTSATTSPSDAAMAANLFSRGTFVDVLYAGSEIDSLRAGSIAGSWNDSWRLMSEDTLNASQITSFDAVADFGASAAKRTRALQMFRYLTIGAPGGVQSNVLGPPTARSRAVGTHCETRARNRSTRPRGGGPTSPRSSTRSKPRPAWRHRSRTPPSTTRWCRR